MRNQKKKLKTTRGITLIALVITIIVLLILAGVTISALSGDNGILTQAGKAKEQTEIAEVKEMVQTDILGEQSKEENKGKLLKGKFVEILNKYFKEVPTEEKLPGDLTSLILETKEEYGSHKIKISEIYNGTFPKTPQPVESLKVGDKVYYNTGNTNVGDNGVIECTVLYDKAYNEESGTNYGIQIISSDVIKNAEGTAVNVTLGGNDFEEAKYSYNNALKILYDKAQEYLNSTYASEARCVGSDPADSDWDVMSDEAGYWTEEYASEGYYEYMIEMNGMLKNADNKYKKDWEQLKLIEKKGDDIIQFWVASRAIEDDSGGAYVGISLATFGHYTEFQPRTDLFCLPPVSGNVHGFISSAFRPVLTLKSGIKVTQGDGTNTPYTLLAP